MKKCGGILLFMLYANYGLIGQTFGERVGFVKYLLNNELYKDATIELKEINNSIIMSSTQQDSLNYYMGKSYFYNNLDSSLVYFNKLKYLDKGLFDDSKLILSYLYILKNDPKKSIKLIEDLNLNDIEDECLVDLLSYSAKTLSQTILDSCRIICPTLNYQYETLNYSQYKLKRYKIKSPTTAGFLSALVPGLGKGYAGKPKEGISSFIVVTLLGYQTYEGYRIGGKTDTRFLVFGSLFSIFYIGNIWGSALSVQISKHEVYDEIYHDITTTLRIPIDRVFKGN